MVKSRSQQRYRIADSSHRKEFGKEGPNGSTFSYWPRSAALLTLYGSRTECRVRSYDSDEGSVRATSAFLDRMGLEDWVTCGLVAGSLRVKTAPIIIWDFDKNPKRVDLMPDAYANLEPGGIMYVDDMPNVEISDMGRGSCVGTHVGSPSGYAE